MEAHLQRKSRVIVVSYHLGTERKGSGSFADKITRLQGLKHPNEQMDLIYQSIDAPDSMCHLDMVPFVPLLLLAANCRTSLNKHDRVLIFDGTLGWSSRAECSMHSPTVADWWPSRLNLQ